MKNQNTFTFAFAKIENKILAVRQNDYLTMTLVVPSLNIENMKQITNCTIISKTPTSLNCHHNAGTLFSVKIRVQFKNIEKYLLTENIFGAGHASQRAENIEQYLNILGKKWGSTYYAEGNIISSRVGLYAFGNCEKRWSGFRGGNSVSVHYFGRNGAKISLNKKASEINRYVNFKGQWMSNRSF